MYFWPSREAQESHCCSRLAEIEYVFVHRECNMFSYMFYRICKVRLKICAYLAVPGMGKITVTVLLIHPLNQIDPAHLTIWRPINTNTRWRNLQLQCGTCDSQSGQGQDRSMTRTGHGQDKVRLKRVWGMFAPCLMHVYVGLNYVLGMFKTCSGHVY